MFIVAAETLFPTVFSAGTLSPVSADSLTALSPSVTTPSTGMLSPGRTINISPIFTLSAGIVISFPSRIMLAVFGVKLISPFRASVV